MIYEREEKEEGELQEEEARGVSPRAFKCSRIEPEHDAMGFISGHAIGKKGKPTSFLMPRRSKHVNGEVL